MNLMFLGWHVPAAYDFALEHEQGHEVEHLCSLGALILFWWPHLRPCPSRESYAGWLLIVDLVMADSEYGAFGVSGFLRPAGLPLLSEGTKCLRHIADV
jgi:cytochrome c oxidase assembly factor CtaG